MSFYLINNATNYGKLREAGLMVDTVSLGKKVWEFPDTEATQKLFAEAGIVQDDVDAGAQAAQNPEDLQDADEPAVCNCGSETDEHNDSCPMADSDSDGDVEEGQDVADLDDNTPPPVQKKTSNQNVAQERMLAINPIKSTEAQRERQADARVRKLVEAGVEYEDAVDSVSSEIIGEAIGLEAPRKSYARQQRGYRENLKPMRRQTREAIDINVFDGEYTGQTDNEARVAATMQFLRESMKRAKPREARVIAGVIRRLESANQRLIKLECLKPLN